MSTTSSDGLSVERIDLEHTPDNVDLAGGPAPDAWRFVRSVVERATERHDDLAIALLVRARDERSDEIALEQFLERQGFDVSELEREIDAEDE
jgi:hypothetical protein